jgi:hypothetical protein
MVLYSLLLLSVVNGTGAKSPSEPLSLSEAIAKVEAAERLYHDHDVRFRVEMRLDEAMVRRFQAPKRGGTTARTSHSVQVSATADWQGHFVSQGGMFRLDRKGGNVSVDGDRDHSFDLIEAFDGETQRRLNQNVVANVSRTRKENRDRFWPHTLVLGHAHLYGPLSLILRGEPAIKASPFADQLKPGVSFASRIEGVEQVEGLLCRKVVLGIIRRGAETGRFELFLAQERNLIPVKMLQYTRESTTKPSATAVVREWKELRPGIWSPLKIDLTVYDSAQLREHDIQHLGWTQKYFVESIDLNPHYPREYFSNVPIPKGTKIN